MADIQLDPGDELEVDYEAENTGGETVAQMVTLTVAGTERDSDSPVIVPPGDTKPGTLRWVTPTNQTFENVVAEVAGPDSAGSFTVSVFDPTDVYDFDSDSIGDSSPGPWQNISGTNAVDSSRSLSGGQSMYLQQDTGQRYIKAQWSADQYVDTFGFAYNETTNSSNVALEFFNGDGDALLYVGSTNPTPTAEGSSTTTIYSSPSPQYDVWRRFEVTFDWSANEATVDWFDIGGSSPNQSATVSLRNVSRYDLGGVALRNSGQSSAWGGNGQDCWVDDVVISTK